MKHLAIRPVIVITIAILLAAAGAILWGLDRFAEGDRPLFDEVAEIMRADAAKGRFTGQLGDFAIYPRTGEAPESTSVQCGSTSETRRTDRPDELLGQELWSDVFGLEPFATLCDGLLITVNNGVRPADGADSIVMTYVDALPALVLFDAPRDRIELIEVAGHPAVIEQPIDGYPYASASLAILVRRPTADEPGIMAYVNFADSSEVAIALAERMIS